MNIRVLLLPVLSLGLVLFAGCSETPSSEADNQPSENYDTEERSAAAKLTPAKDPIQEEGTVFRSAVRELCDGRRFVELERQAADLRTSKALFGNGTWKIRHFYDALACHKDAPESKWQSQEQIHREWIAQQPSSVTARVAYAEFLTQYAWRARGAGYVDKVTEEGWRGFEERLAASRKVLDEAKSLPEKDPMWWLVAMDVALGQGWSKAEYDSLIDEATAFEPTFWYYDTSRAHSLLPRWHGEPGDWEAYAEQAASRPNGLGAETYARIVFDLRRYYENPFRETQVSWPKVREGQELMRKRYPESVGIVSSTALLATMAEDRALAKQMFEQLGDTYLPHVWGKPERFTHYRHWAETGKW